MTLACLFQGHAYTLIGVGNGYLTQHCRKCGKVKVEKIA